MQVILTRFVDHAQISYTNVEWLFQMPAYHSYP
jgi:hypothetical protein